MAVHGRLSLGRLSIEEDNTPSVHCSVSKWSPSCRDQTRGAAFDGPDFCDVSNSPIQ
ncbi:hypothetical protein K461DRAFT_277558 [Myriangium duriaei CBS 260.36]|uniref:Uncharacterized protein n=1 Tax=Myriangium duriaei CBS 260.36 TaxID=1168546 RepID=A0A9P4MP78_9PEZI|nr:hypothetical protein K461DRAFT_277558 [Myriangium duriaei CBS 260.36]